MHSNAIRSLTEIVILMSFQARLQKKLFFCLLAFRQQFQSLIHIFRLAVCSSEWMEEENVGGRGE